MEEMEVVDVDTMSDDFDYSDDSYDSNDSYNSESPDFEKVEEGEDINPDDLFEDYEDPDMYKVAGYDLSKYKDVLNFEEPEKMEEFNAYIEKLQKAGFTQEQIEFLIDDELNDSEEKPKVKTNKEIKEELQKELTKDEKRNYKAVYAFVGNNLKNTEFEGKVTQIMQNPALVKVMNIMYKNSLGKTTNLKSMQKPNEKQLRTMTLDEAYNKLLESTKDKDIDRKALIKELKSRVADRKGLDHLLSIING